MDRLLSSAAVIDVIAPRGDISLIASEIEVKFRDIARLGQTSTLVQKNASTIKNILQNLISKLFGPDIACFCHVHACADVL